MRNRNSGFTLVEMLVTIAAAALVMVAVSSLLLTGLRLEKNGSETVAAQRDSRVVLTMLENIAAEGQIDKIEYDASDWSIKKKTDAEYETILSYDSSAQTINGKDGGVIVDEVSFADIYYDSKLLKCSITNASGESYSTSVYCRVGTIEAEGITVNYLSNAVKKEEAKLEAIESPTLDENEQKARYAFLVTLLSQYGSTGKIIDELKFGGGLYYSRWYNLEWGRGTAWCACFLSWGLWRELYEVLPDAEIPRLHAYVQNVKDFQFATDDEDDKVGDWIPANCGCDESMHSGNHHVPIPGDLVFFERGDDETLDHIGCVLYVDETNGKVYTIEGNNNNRVGIFSYSLDPAVDIANNSEMYIVGYGVIEWDKYLPKSSSEN